MRFLVTVSILAGLCSLAASQTLPSIQNSGDIYADILRNQVNNSGSADTFTSPFNFGFVITPTALLRYAPPIEFTHTEEGSTGLQYQNDLFYANAIMPNQIANSSQIWWNFGAIQYDIGQTLAIPSFAITFYSVDVYPSVETKVGKGTYTFHATATPTTGSSTPGVFEFETYTNGVWATQFSLNLTKAAGDTRTLTFSGDTRVRWLLIPNSGQTAEAAIVARFYATNN
jgi:hypothetical protein